MTDTLAQRLRTETKEAHVTAERSGIMRALLRGAIDRPSYVRLLRNLAEIYRALEGELDTHRDVAALAGLDLLRLRRLPALAQDIADLEDDAPAQDLRPATHAYVSRLHELGTSSPDLLLAHAYVRYLGDLSGGQILSGIIARSLALPGEEGTAFYRFPRITDLDAFKVAFREGLNAAAEFTSVNAVVEEAQHGFALHAQLFEELK